MEHTTEAERLENAEMGPDIAEDGLVRMPNGKHAGELITRVPVGYLQWMVNEGHTYAHLASAELQRRGTVFPTIEISGHAIDRASLRCRKLWHNDRRDDEGLHAWLVRVSAEALATGTRRGDKVHWKGMKLVFHFGEVYPTLKTVMPKGRLR